jgi:hypothetical protein
MAQQTSVEWLVNRWKKLQSKGAKMSWNQIIEITELAKEMHKEETIRFVQTMPAYIAISQECKPYVQYDAEEHYNKTFNNGTHIN